MNLYLIREMTKDGLGYDSYDSAVVAAPDEESAKNMHPGGGTIAEKAARQFTDSTWVTSPELVSCELIGEASNQQAGVVLASFNAG